VVAADASADGTADGAISDEDEDISVDVEDVDLEDAIAPRRGVERER
jgi:hypothetical protein